MTTTSPSGTGTPTGSDASPTSSKRGGVKPQDLPNYIHASEVIDVMDELNDALAEAGVTVAESEDLASAEGLDELLLDLPSRAVAVEIRKLLHADSTTRWEPNDLDDFAALGVALPYCDVVVTERRWRHLIQRAELDARFGTVVLSDLRKLPQALTVHAA